MEDKFKIKKIIHYFNDLTTREKILVSAPCILILGYILNAIVASTFEYIEDKEKLLKRRENQVESINYKLKKYKLLNDKFAKIESTLSSSILSFEEVTAKLESIVKESLGESNFNIQKTRSPKDIGLDYEVQEFQIKANNLSMNQLTTLLDKLENGDAPLFLGKINIKALGSKRKLSVNLEVSSIKKQNA